MLTLVLHSEVRATSWANVKRHEPSESGDTPLAFGLFSSEDFAQQIFRACMAHAGPSSERGIRASKPNNSLLIQVVVLNQYLIMASFRGLRILEWRNDLDWRLGIATRPAAAAHNSRVFQPPTVSAWSLLSIRDDAVGEALARKEPTIMWSGDIPTGLTAGWMGLPQRGDTPWMAVAPLWWDEPASRTEDRQSLPISPVAARVLPTPNFKLRPKASRKDGAQ
ncbi:hypothetical protein MPY17_13965 [Rhodococcus opacus]|uniref:hypothetical protein n=1 Tax=Rhodococcus opacus TaxID=37919 RepID=UPI001FF2080F|nr:hypothetical protein [Rhodococcus opacus]UOT06775.1 hypothetical protein MPY17_13965 [Rhodococcus opacus]